MAIDAKVSFLGQTERKQNDIWLMKWMNTDRGTVRF